MGMNAENYLYSENYTYKSNQTDKTQNELIKEYQGLLSNVMGKYIKLHSDFKRMQDYYQKENKRLHDLIEQKGCSCDNKFESDQPDFLEPGQSQLKVEQIKKVKEHDGDITIQVGSSKIEAQNCSSSNRVASKLTKPSGKHLHSLKHPKIDTKQITSTKKVESLKKKSDTHTATGTSHHMLTNRSFLKLQKPPNTDPRSHEHRNRNTVHLGRSFTHLATHKEENNFSFASATARRTKAQMGCSQWTRMLGGNCRRNTNSSRRRNQ